MDKRESQREREKMILIDKRETGGQTNKQRREQKTHTAQSDIQYNTHKR